MLDPYEPRGNCSALFRCVAPEVLLSGPAGTGKSVANLAKMNWLAKEHPGFRGLFIRKTKRSLSTSGLVTFERDVLHPDHPSRHGAHRASRTAYQYPNGSEIDVGGLDDPGKIMSTDYDCVYAQEAYELEESDADALITRIGRRRLPGLECYQLMMDTNPAGPLHWLLRRCQTGRCLMLETRHEDNPNLWDGKAWTEWAYNARKDGYLDRLDQLPDVLYQRYRKGRWVQATGVVYGGFDSAVHLVSPFPIPWDWPRILGIDWGYNNPTVVQWWALDPDNRLYLYREVYRSHAIVEDIARQVKQLSFGEPEPAAIICDHDSEDRATFEFHTGWQTMPANKGKGSKSSGLYAVMARLRKSEDGKPRLFILRDALVERDPDLDTAKRPCSTAEEFDCYIWDQKNGKIRGDEPLKENDHGCFVAGTPIATEGGWLPIESIRTGMRVWTRQGLRRVLAAGCTDRRADVGTVAFSDGRTLTGTGDHPMFSATGFARLDALRYNDCVADIEEFPCVSLPCRRKITMSFEFGLMARFTAAIPSARTEETEFTTDAGWGMLGRDTAGYIGTFGNTTMGQSRTDGKSTTRTATRSTICQPISNVLLPPIIESCTNQKADNAQQSRTRKPTSMSCSRDSKRLPIGTDRQKAELGIVSMRGEFGGTCPTERSPVSTVARSTALARQETGCGFAQANAEALLAGRPELTTRKERADSAARCLPSTDTRQCGPVRARVLRSFVKQSREPVYNLTVEGCPEYFVNGFLAHNCDAMRYVVWGLDGETATQEELTTLERIGR